MNKDKNNDNKLKKAPKAYDNKRFLHSPAGREIRILSEYHYPEYRFQEKKIHGTIIFFGSARSKPKETYDRELFEMLEQQNQAKKELKKVWSAKIEKYKLKAAASGFYQDAVELAYLLAEWTKQMPHQYQYHICTGGGPGIMEAANRGASISGTHSIGLNISLPFEQEPNQFISPDLNFEFHYFFMRKFWFIYMAKAIVAFPGGFGTLDELFDCLTLVQTKKHYYPLPVLLYSREFWNKLINFDYMVELGMISPEDIDLFSYADTPTEAFNYLTKELIRLNKLEKFFK